MIKIGKSKLTSKKDAKKKNKKQLDAIFSSMKDAIFVISEDYKILFKNETTHDNFGENLIGKDCFNVLSGVEQPCENCPIKTLSEKDVCQVHFERCVDNPLLDEIKYFDVITTPIENYEGKRAYLELLRDITKRKQMEDLLKENERLLNEAQGIAHIGHWKLNPITMNVSGSDELFNIFDLKEDEATLDKFAEVVHPDDREMDLYYIKRGMDYGESWDIEHRLITGDGTEKWVHAIGEAVKDNTGEVVLLLGTVQDITERKKMEEEMEKYRDYLEELVEERTSQLRESEEWLSTTLNSIGDAVIATDIKGNITFLNPVAESLTGWKQEETIEKSIEDVFNIINEETRKPVESPVLRVLREEFVVGLANHTILIAKDGRETPIDDSGAPIKDDKGNIIGVVLIFRDITERKKSEEVIKRSEEKYRTLFDLSLDGISMINIEGRYIDCNRAQLDMFGYSLDEFKNLTFKEITPERWHENDAVALTKIIEKGYIEDYEKEFIRKDGTIFPVKLSAYLITGIKEEPTAIWASIRDISERKKAEERYKFLLESITDGIIVLDHELRYIIVNDKLVNIAGMPKVELLGNKITDLFPSAEETIFIKTYKKVLETGVPDVVSDMFIFEDGRRRWYEVHVYPAPEGLLGIISDITERKEFEAELRVKDNAIKSSINAIAIADLEGNLTYVNPSFLKMWGYSSEKGVLGKGIIDFWQMEEKATEVIRCLQETGNWVGELIAKRKDGSYFDVQLSVSMVMDANGRPMSMMASFIDITDHKKAEAKDAQKTAIMNARNAIFQKALTCKSEEDLGKTCLDVAQELSGAKFGFFGEINQEGKFDMIAISNPGWDACKMPDSEATRIIKGMEIHGMQFLPLVHGKSYIFNDPGNHPDSVGTPKGHPKIKCLLTVPFMYKGEIIGQIGLGNKEGGFNRYDQEAIEALSIAMIEALMRKRAEEAVKESELRFRSVFESKMIGTLFWDANGDINDANDAFLDMIGYTRDEVLSRAVRWRDMTPPEYTEQDNKALEEIAATGIMTPIEKEYICKDGSRIPILLGAASLPGSTLNGVAFVVNITERKIAEEKLKKTLKDLKRSNTELEQFAYVASHDLQEPLRMVASFTQLLQNRYQDKLDDDANDFINYAVDGATRMQNLISDLLIFSRVGTRGKPFKTTDMNAVLEAVIATFQQKIKETNTVLTYKPLPVIIADESQMIQLLQNLISNAIKFRREEPPRIHVSGEVKADKWIFSVSDNGIGMDSKYFDRIFVIFQRLHKKDEYGGTGIGLAVCKKIIQRHSGKIWVESELGKGSTFTFSIPKREVGQKL